jgi:outer membrane protein assembly factor BamB
VIRKSLLLISLVLAAAGVVLPADDPSASPMMAALKMFSAPGIPAAGPGEAEAPVRNWPDPTSAQDLPGRGLAQHPMLFAGEGYNMLFVVNEGKVIWTYSTGKGGEIDDVWMLSNGHILFTTQYHVYEVTPRKEIVWHYDAPEGTEIHTCQPIGIDKVMFVQNGLPPKLIVMNKKTGAVETEHALPAPSPTDPKTVHPQFRRVRVTAKGTYLAAHLNMNKVVEYDRNFEPIWTYEIPSPWAAVRLRNGNTLIDDERERLVREVNPKGEIVWEFRQTDLPPGVVFHNIQTADRLANGNTVIFSSTGGTKREDRPNIIQAVEVTPDKKVVWVLQDWKNLGPATTAQFLDQPGVPERPGELER